MSLKWAQAEIDAAIRREFKAEQEEAEKIKLKIDQGSAP